VELFLSGESIMDISRKLDVDPYRTRILLRELGYTVRSIRTNFSEKFGDEIEQLYHSGWGCTQLSKRFSTSEAQILQILNRRGVQTGKYLVKYDFDEHYLDNIDTQEKSYFIGYYLGDGCNSGSAASITSIDRHILVDMLKLFKSNSPIYTMKKNEEHHYTKYKFSIGSVYLCNKLTEYGCHPNKTFTTFLPKIDDELYKGLILGLIDSDGCITNNGKSWWVSIAGSHDLIHQTHDWIENKFNFKVGVYPNKNIYELRISAKSSLYTFLSWLYSDATIYMNRKYKKYLQFCNEHGFTPVKTGKLNP